MEEQKIIQQSSIEVTRNSKGFNYAIKVYGDGKEDIMKKFNELKELVETRIADEQIQQELK